MKVLFYLSFQFLISILFVSNVFAQDYYPVTDCGTHEGGITVMTKDYAKNLVIAGDETGNLYFHDIQSGQLLNTVKAHSAAVKQIQFNSTGKLLISATHDGEIKIFDFASGKIIQGIFSPDYSGIRFVLFSIADGFIYFNGNKKLFKTRSDLSQQVNLIYTESDTITDAVITNDRSSLIFATGSILKVLNTRTDIIRQEFNTGSSKIERMSLVQDTLLATWSSDGTIYFWHYLLGQLNPTPVFFMKAGNPAPMNFSEDGSLMSSGLIGNWARLWKPMERKIVQELFFHSKTVTSTCFGINNENLFTGSLDTKILLWKRGEKPIEKDEKNIQQITNKTEPVIDTPTVIVKTPSPEIEMSEENVPKFISGRKVVSNIRIETTAPDVTVFVFDNSTLDGDTLSLFFNGTWILDRYGVTKKKVPVSLNLKPNTNNFLVLFANNLGKSPPNTAVIEFDDGKSKRLFRLSSDLNSCSAVNFYYKK